MRDCCALKAVADGSFTVLLTLPSVSGLDLPFMMMPHPLLPMGLPPASVAMAMSQMNHLSTIANMAAAAQQIHTHVHRAPVIKVTLDRLNVNVSGGVGGHREPRTASGIRSNKRATVDQTNRKTWMLFSEFLQWELDITET